MISYKHRAGSKYGDKRILRNVLWLSDFTEVSSPVVRIILSAPRSMRNVAETP